MRRMLALITVLALLVAGCVCDAGERVPDQQTVLARGRGTFDGWEGETLELQRKLVRWYNWNLTANRPDWRFRETYGSILAGPGGVMGTIRFPAAEAELPLLHEGCEGEGFIHRADSAFPIGDGNTVLIFGREQALLWASWLGLEEGSLFEIRILDMVVTYRVTSITAAGEYSGTAKQSVLILPGEEDSWVVIGEPVDEGAAYP